MSDPAREAAQAAFLEQWPDQGEFEFRHSIEGQFGREAARAALKPIREVHAQIRNFDYAKYEWVVLCRECHHLWPCRTARLTYTEDEL